MPIRHSVFLDEDGVDAGLGDKVGLDLWWQSADVPETVVEALVTEEPSRREPPAVVDDEGSTGAEPLIRLYLQRAGTVPLLMATDEVHLAEQWHTANAYLLQVEVVAPTDATVLLQGEPVRATSHPGPWGSRAAWHLHRPAVSRR
jgi:Sigma-70 factor, region 1.2